MSTRVNNNNLITQVISSNTQLNSNKKIKICYTWVSQCLIEFTRLFNQALDVAERRLTEGDGPGPCVICPEVAVACHPGCRSVELETQVHVGKNSCEWFQSQQYDSLINKR